MGDGRAWLGPVLREYIVSEAMQAYGVPTTRALAAVGLIDLAEPFAGLFTQGMVTHETYKAPDGRWLAPDEVRRGPVPPVDAPRPRRLLGHRPAGQIASVPRQGLGILQRCILISFFTGRLGKSFKRSFNTSP